MKDTLIALLKKAGIEVRMLTPGQEQDILRKISENPEYGGELQLISREGFFYSNAERAVRECRQDKATPAQWLAMLEKAGGIKAAEDKWLGLSEWLKGQTATVLQKKELLDYIEANRIVLHEEEFENPEETEDYRKLNEEFRQKMDKIEEWFETSSQELEDFYADMRKKYSMEDDWEDEWVDRMTTEDEQEEERLQENRQKYNLMVRSREEIAFEEMVDKYGQHFDNAFGYSDENLVVGDDDEMRYFISSAPIDETRMENTTGGLDKYHEIAVWTENTVAWKEKDYLHFGDVGRGKCIGWIRFGETTTERPLSEKEWMQKVCDMPTASEWHKYDGSEFVAGKDLYYPPGKSRYVHTPYISKAKTDNSYTYHPLKGSAFICMSLEDAVRRHWLETVPKVDRAKVLVIDEIQSNRHQEGRKKGYQVSDKELERWRDEFAGLQDEKQLFQQEMRQKYGSEMFGHYMNDEEMKRLGKIEERLREMGEMALDNAAKVPQAPLEKNWHELCMKRMLRYAAENGFDKVAWTTGEQQAERYNLVQVLQAVSSKPYEAQSAVEVDGYDVDLYTNIGKTELYVDRKGYICSGEINNNSLQGVPLEKLVGRELAEKIIKSKEPMEIKNVGDNFRFGYEGMKVFYDTVLPQFMNKYGKKWDVKVGEVRFPHLSWNNGYNGSCMTMYGVDVTPEMKDSVMQGQPMFMRDRKGHIYGMAMGNTVYLTEKGMNPETLLHEYTHVWAMAMKNANPQGWQSVKDLLKGTPVWDEVTQDCNYSHIRGNEDKVASEALARVSGRANAGKMAAYAQKSTGMAPVKVLNRLKTAVGKFWSWVGKHMFDIERFASVEEVTDRVLYDLLKGQRIETGEVLAVATDTPDQRVTQATVYKGKYGLPYIRCKVDGVWQNGKPVRNEDVLKVRNPERIAQVAEKYFCKGGQDRGETTRRGQGL